MFAFVYCLIALKLFFKLREEKFEVFFREIDFEKTARNLFMDESCDEIGNYFAQSCNAK
jgi:hypothetical protein